MKRLLREISFFTRNSSRNDNRKVEIIDHGWKVECCKVEVIYMEGETSQSQKEFAKIFERNVSASK